MPQLQIVLTDPGESQQVTVIWVDENLEIRSTEILVELMNQDAPRLLGVKVDNRPVLLRSSDIVFHAGQETVDA